MVKKEEDKCRLFGPSRYHLITSLFMLVFKLELVPCSDISGRGRAPRKGNRIENIPK